MRSPLRIVGLLIVALGLVVPVAAAPGVAAAAPAATAPKAVQDRIATASLHLWKGSTGKTHAQILKKGSVVRTTGVSANGRLQIVRTGKVYWVTAKWTRKAQWVERISIGTSVKGKPIYAYQVGDPAARKSAVVIGRLHGDERAGVDTANALIDDTRSVKGISLWVIPTSNPDGLAARTRSNAHGVDLNRNWPENWAKTAKGRYYAGTKGLSEPENKALAAFLTKRKPSYVVGIHQPLFGVDSDGVKDKELSDRLARHLQLPSKAFTCRTGCTGTMTQWFNKNFDGAAITVEYGPKVTSRYAKVVARDGFVRALGGRY